jgi:hypothetical protein
MTAANTLRVIALAVAAFLVAPAPALAQQGATQISSYSWTNIRPTVPFDPAMWQPRAGLRAVEGGNDLFVMGGRGPFSFDTGTPIYGDVWKSSDLGMSWSKVVESGTDNVETMWQPRAYFGAVRHRGRLFVVGGQNFETRPNPIFPDACAVLPPGVPCLPVIPNSTFFADVWSSADGENWRAETLDAPWEGRAGLSVVVHRGAIFVIGGSQGDDVATGGTGRVLFNDVWMSRDGRNWKEMTGTGPRWSPRAGAVVVSKGPYLYLLGGERGFSCGFDAASPCQPATATLYFNDVWRSKDGAEWELVTASAGWSPRPGHQCVVLLNQIVCFGGYGEIPGVPPVPANPTDIWTSRDGRQWTELMPPASPPWNGGSPADMKYDFHALVVSGNRVGQRPSIMTFGGDRERFGLPDDVNAFLLDNDVWVLSPD